MVTLRDKIRSRNSSVILYELIPPPCGKDTVYLDAILECTQQLVSSSNMHVDGINIPEIHPESGRGNANHQNKQEQKIEPRVFAQHLRQAFNNGIEFVINRCTVYDKKDQHLTWLQQTYKEYGIENLVLVGGESSKIHYPGPSVTAMSQFIHQQFNQQFYCGGITIPTRRHPGKAFDEPNRLIVKAQSGIEYFTSQVIYEAENTIRLLKDYDALCKQQGINAKRIFLSFAPVSLPRDIEFLRWLGVEIPLAVEQRLLQADIGIGWRSIQLVKEILEKILEFVATEDIQVPLGLNIEHVSRHNFELSKEFIEQLGMLYKAL